MKAYELAAENKGMRREIERLRAELSARKCVVTGCGMYDADEIDQLRAELAECRRDAERYRWIIRNMHLSIAQNGAWWSLTDASQVAPNHISEVGSTIDAAIAAKGE